MVTFSHRLIPLACFLFYSCLTATAEFDPYQMNGGLVSAVAGKDFVVLATDTRLSQEYTILGRRHVSSRLWTPANSFLSSSPDGSLKEAFVSPTFETASSLLSGETLFLTFGSPALDAKPIVKD